MLSLHSKNLNKIRILTSFKVIHNIILILFRKVNLDNINYVIIVNNVIIDTYYAEAMENFSNICYANVQ